MIWKRPEVNDSEFTRSATQRVEVAENCPAFGDPAVLIYTMERGIGG